MNDLSSLDWTSKSQDPKKPTAPNPSYYFANIRPSPPISGRSTPFNGALSNPASKPTTPANDSFANLVSFNTSHTNKNLSLQERQRLLAEEKRKQALGQENNQFSAVDEQIWESLGSGRGTPAVTTTGQENGIQSWNGALPEAEDDDDLLAALNAPTSHQSSMMAGGSGLLVKQPNLAQERSLSTEPQLGALTIDDEDDPFGLNQLEPSHMARTAITSASVDTDDVLGLLGQPIESLPTPTPLSVTVPEAVSSNPQDHAVAELVEMGFPMEKVQHALGQTESGTDVQAAVGFLLNQAHTESRQKLQSQNPNTRSQFEHSDIPQSSRARASGNNRPGSTRRREDATASAQTENPSVQIATELSATLLKTAGSLWKQSAKKFQQAVEEFNSDSDSSQPRWMKDPERMPSEKRTQAREGESGVARRRRRSSAARDATLATDEVMMLETARPEARRPVRSRVDHRFDSSADNSRDHSPAVPSRLRENTPVNPAFLRQQQTQPPASKQALSRKFIEEQASQGYVSSARRRKPPPHPPVSAPEPDLPSISAQAKESFKPVTIRPSQSAPPSVPIAVRPVAPPRAIPPLSAVALKSSHSHREAGNAHFKRGDYSSAHASYATSLSCLPPTHPIAIILLTNHALTALKVGEPKTAIADSETAIKLIGPGKGESESIDLGIGNTPKPMREYYGKALMRKAEALEETERWTEAAAMWRAAVEGGHGGATSIQGRARAEKAANPTIPKPKPPVMRKQAISAPPRHSATPRNSARDNLSGRPLVSETSSAAAVHRLRAANAASEKADDEKFALADKVDAKLAAWKGGKTENLRALLGSLDTVLWPEASWKKIGMADLVLPGKVKIQYMKGIAKVHPDKIPTTATTEQRMIAGAVFSTLNEAWDRFKKENSL